MRKMSREFVFILMMSLSLLVISPALADSWKMVKVTTTIGGTVKCEVTKGSYYYVHLIGEADTDVFWAIAGSKLVCTPYPKSGYEFDGWTGTPGDLQENNYVKNVNDGVDIVAHFKPSKVKVTFTYSGSSIAPEVTYQVSGSSPQTETAPFSIQVDKGKSITFSYETQMGNGGTRYILDSVSHSSPITANCDMTIRATYHTEYYLKVISAHDTPTPASGWFVEGEEITAEVSSPVGGGGSRYICTGWTGSGSVPSSGSQKSVTFKINEPSSITWNWETQYLVTFRQMGLGSDAHGLVVTVNGEDKDLTDMPYALWVDEGKYVKYSYQTTVNGISKYWLQKVIGPSSQIKVNKQTIVTGIYLNMSSFNDMNIFGDGFRLIYTEDKWNPLTYKLTASGPGQFQYSVFYLGTPGEDITMDVSIPYPFTTVGDNPVRAYGYVETIGPGMIEPSQELKYFKITGTETTTGSGSLGIVLADYGENVATATSKLVIRASGTVPETGLVMLTVQLEYGLKGSVGYTADSSSNAMIGFGERITNNEAYTFSYTVGKESGNTTIHNENIFKANNGFAGIVTDEDGNPIEGARVYLYGPYGNFIGSTLTDSDGWYGFSYKHSGGPASYTLSCNGVVKTVNVFSGQKSVVDF
jgi:hypothetical protein